MERLSLIDLPVRPMQRWAAAFTAIALVRTLYCLKVLLAPTVPKAKDVETITFTAHFGTVLNITLHPL